MDAEDQSGAVPQPHAFQRTAPYGQPKIQGDGQPRPGDPSPEALRRLQAAVSNVPKAQPMVRSLAQAPGRPDAERTGRLTINSLIHKMTGQAHRDSAAERPRTAGPAFESQANEPSDAEYESTERERVDIPAFLRRQAN
jgi:cell division protein FtsZ